MSLLNTTLSDAFDGQSTYGVMSPIHAYILFYTIKYPKNKKRQGYPLHSSIK